MSLLSFLKTFGSTPPDIVPVSPEHPLPVTTASDAPAYTSSVAVSAEASFTRPNNTTAYDAGDVVSNSTSAPAVLEFDFGSNAEGATLLLTAASLRVDVSAMPSGMGAMNLHLYDVAPTAINDAAAFDLPSGDRSKHLGHVVLFQPEDLGTTIKSNNDTLTKQVALAAGSTKLFGILVTANGYTPTASAVKTIRLRGLRVG
jgi:hypothetical protein